LRKKNKMRNIYLEKLPAPGFLVEGASRLGGDRFAIGGRRLRPSTTHTPQPPKTPSTRRMDQWLHSGWSGLLFRWRLFFLLCVDDKHPDTGRAHQ
jgi:hypothetical protein